MANQLKSPIFILGSHKSGSSLLRSLLDNHPSLFVVPTEMHFFQLSGYWIDYKLRAALPQQLSQSEVLEKMVDFLKLKNKHKDPYSDSSTPNFFDLIEFRKVVSEAKCITKEDLFSTYVHAIYKSLKNADMPSGLRIVEKSVENAEYASLLKIFFPDCSFLHIIRNPYASLLSIRKAKSNQGYPFLKDIIKSITNNYYNLYKNETILDNYFIVKYEDLISETQTTMQAISKFIGLEFKETLLKPTLMGRSWSGNSSSSSSFSSVSKKPLSSWKSEINGIEIHLINSNLSHVLERFRYEKVENHRKHFLLSEKDEGIKTYLKNRMLPYFL